MKDGFYSSQAWKELRKKTKATWLRSNRPCPYCHKAMDKTQRLIVDHIKNRKRHPHLALDPNNTQLVHWSCNTKKYYHVEANTKEPVDAKGYPAGWQD